jgi:hypothetical protein
MTAQHHTLPDLIACATRETKMRRRVYPRWVEQGKMQSDTANREIAMMETIAEILTRLQDATDLIPTLSGDEFVEMVRGRMGGWE